MGGDLFTRILGIPLTIPPMSAFANTKLANILYPVNFISVVKFAILQI